MEKFAVATALGIALAGLTGSVPAAALEVSVGWEFEDAGGNLRLEADSGRLRLEISQEPSARDRREIEALVAENLRAFNDEDLDAYMATLDPSAPAYERARAAAAERFSQYDLEATAEAVDILAVEGDAARVRVVQVTRQVGADSDFQNNRFAAVHRLRKVAGQWKFYGLQDIQQVPAADP